MERKPLWKHQELAIEKAKSRAEYAFLFDPGLGKTRATIETLRHRFNTDGRVMRTLIIAPTITLRNWKDEFAQFMNIPPEKILVIYGPGKKRQATFATEVLSGSPDKIVITNYESLLMKDLMKMLLNWKPENIVADEMHLVKNSTSRRAQALRQIAFTSRFRFGLTGTPVLNNLMDFFSQWWYLDGGKTFGTNFFAFKNRFFFDKNANMPKHLHFPKLAPKSGALEQIRAIIQPMASSAIKSECLDLPPLIRQTISVEMSSEMRKHYKSLKDDFMTWAGHSDAPVIASTALVKMLRLMQLTSGFLKPDGQDEIPLKTNPKEEALEELLEGILPNKAIIWAVFKRDYETIKRVCNKLKIPYVECHGEISNNKKFENVDAFNKNPDIKVFIGHPQSLGIGINLVAASYMVYFSRTFSLGNDIQSEARNYRAGSEIHEKITRYDIIMKGSVDELCFEALAAKAEVSSAVLRNWIDLNLL